MIRRVAAAFARRREADRDDDGFTVVEVVVATAVFAILATAFAATLSASLRSLALSRARTTAEQLASSQLEEMRRVDYDNLGTVGGNPPGTVAPSKAVTTGNQTLTVATQIEYVNDPAPSAKETGADYKSVLVTVTSSAAVVLAKESTLVAPPTQASQTDGLMKVRIVDYALNQPVAGATVTLGTGPDAPIADDSDANGNVAFAALTPNPTSGTKTTYTLTVAKTGYQTLPEDQPPAPAAATALASGQVFSTDLHLFKPVTLNVHLVDTNGAPFTTASTLEVSSIRGADTTTVSNGTAALTSVGSSPLIPNVSYTVGASAPGYYASSTTFTMATSYPTVLSTDITLVMKPYSTGTIQVTLKDSSASVINGLDLVITGGPASVAVVGTTNSSGIATLAVPAGTSPVYTISVPTQSPYASASTTKAGPIAGTTVTVGLTVAKS